MDRICRPKCKRSPAAVGALLVGLMFTALAFIPALPTPAHAQVCNTNMNIAQNFQHNFLLPNETYTIDAVMTTGNLSGGTASIHRFNYMQECDPDSPQFIPCLNLNNTPTESFYSGDSFISQVGGTCVNAGGTALAVRSNLPSGGSGAVNNQIIFEFYDPTGGCAPASCPASPLHLVQSDSTGCTIRFKMQVLARDDGATPNQLEQALGYDAATSDAQCFSSTGVLAGTSGVTQSSLIPICPTCATPTTCEASILCNQGTGACVTTFSSSATECRASTGFCDPPETCTGTSAGCPTDAFRATTDVCRSSTGFCDPPELCTATGTCPADTFRQANEVCRSSTGFCDPPELCTGSSGTCPSDVFRENGTCEGCLTAFQGPLCPIGTLSNFAVLILGGDSSNSCPSDVILGAPATTVTGDVGICKDATGDILKLKIDGDLLIQDNGAGLSIHSDVRANSIQFNAGAPPKDVDSINEACNADGVNGDCLDASICAAALPCPPLQTFTTLTGNKTFSPGVTCIGTINTTKKTFTFDVPNVQYIINVSGAGDQTLNNLTIKLLNGVQPSQILWNFTGVGTHVSFFKPDATLAGTVLVPRGYYDQDHGSLAGNVCAACVKLHSGAFVTCPPGGDGVACCVEPGG